MLKLKYIGKVQGIEHLNIDPRMWDVLVYSDNREHERSTKMLEGLMEMGAIPERKVA